MKRITLKHALTDKPKASDFTAVDVPMPACPDGGILMRNIYVSLDPYVGTRLRGNHMGEQAPEPGKGVIPGAGVGQIIDSRADGFAVGDYVHSMESGWQDYAALSAGEFRKIDSNAAPLAAYVGVLGMPGLTAWAGVAQLAKVSRGDVFLVNAAAGPVGGTAGQIAKARGAKTVIGIAGGAKKCAIVTDTYGFEACLDYKTEGWGDRLKTYAPDGITVHFENVSDEMLMFAISNMQLYGRAVLCGLAGHYHKDGPPASIPFGMVIGKRASLHGLVVYDYYDRWTQFTNEIAPLVKAGKIKIIQDRVDGLEAAPSLMERLVNGQNFGKCVVKVSEEKI